MDLDPFTPGAPQGRSPMAKLGQGGCADLLPSEYARYEFKFTRVLRNPPKPPNPGHTPSHENVGVAHAAVRTGVLQEFKQEWRSLGHFLGTLSYSLPLAPCEDIKLSFIEWSRTDAASRSEAAAVSEKTEHELYRGQMVHDTVESAMKAYDSSRKSNSSFSLNLSAGGYGVGLQIPGTTKTSSSSSKEMSGETLREISDKTTQAGASLRELRSAVIVQASQEESANAQTRHVRNHNHCHAMTVLYYEILQHYEVVTRFHREIPILLVRYDVTTFTRESLSCLAHILRPALVDSSLDSCFDRLAPAPTPAPLPIMTKDPTPDTVDQPEAAFIWSVHLSMRIKASSASEFTGVQVALLSRSVPGASLTWTVDVNTPTGASTGVSSDMTVVEAVLVVPAEGEFDRLAFDDVGSIEVRSWAGLIATLEGVSIHGAGVAGSKRVIFEDLSTDALLHSTGDDNKFQAEVPETQPAEAPPTSAVDLGPAVLVDDPCIERLLEHLNCDSLNAYYNLILWLSEDPQRRALRFDNTPMGGGNSLLDLLENRIVGVFGSYLAFPANADPLPPAEIPAPERTVVASHEGRVRRGPPLPLQRL